ncbi:MAG: hypothetical protein LBS27_07755 [Bifidobacteriaceae bacterium]|jgi:membrane protein YqaA with SNARE-associated domain|nr:hypothetical protein [Bifidobacteriaceae bacterium]
MIEWLGVIVGSLGTGFASAVFPVVNAELATGAAAWRFETPLALAAVVALALGQTAGKVVVYQAARGGRAIGHRWRLRRAKRASLNPGPAVGPAEPPESAAASAIAAGVSAQLDPTAVPAVSVESAAQPSDGTVAVASPNLAADAAPPLDGTVAVAQPSLAADAAGPLDLAAPPVDRTAAVAPHDPAALPVDRTAAVAPPDLAADPALPGNQPGKAKPGRWAALGNRLLAAMDRRWRSNAVLALSAVVGMPPLFATSIAAGLLRLRLFDFVACVAAGRIVRLLVIAWPVLALT